MLILYSQFIIRSAIKNPLQLMSPPIKEEGTVSYPRYSVIHYLDSNSDSHFPSRDLHYFKDIPVNKKIPIQHVLDLESKEEISVLENKYVGTEVRKWNKNNLRNFKEVNLLELPNKDSNLLSIFNYNLVKDMYRYKTSILSTYYRYYNLSSTFWTFVKKSLDVDKESVHFIEIDVPNGIPTFNLIDIILKFNNIKFSRVIKNHDLIKIIDLYRWLHSDFKNTSTLKSITDEDSKQIVIQFKYRGYVCFLPLHILKSLSDKSTLESSIKYDDKKVRKIFILMLRKFQDSVNSILENTEVPEEEINDEVNLEKDLDEDDALSETIEEQEDAKSNNLPLSINKIGNTPFFKPKELKEVKIDEKELIATNLNNFIDKEIDIDIENNDSIDKFFIKAINEVNSDKESVQEEQAEPLQVNYSDDYTTSILKESNLDSKFENLLEDNNVFKVMTSAEIRNLKKLKEERNNLKSPYNEKVSIDNDKVIDKSSIILNKESMSIPIPKGIVNEKFAIDVLGNFDKKYINNVYKKDILACVTGIEKAGVIIKKYEVEEIKSSTGDYEIHKLSIKPLTGKESTIYFRLPKIDSEGEILVNGIRIKIRKQKTELPIRKISPIKVALTSNYSKLFIFRTERKTNDTNSYLIKYIQESYMSEDGIVKKIVPGLKNLGNRELPNIYYTLSSNFNEVITEDYTFILNPDKISNYLDKETINSIQNDKYTFIGFDRNKNVLVTNESNNIFNYTNSLESVGYVEDLLGIDRDKLPKSFSCIKILGDDIPLGVVLSYYLGIDGLLSVTKTKFTTIESNKQYKANKNELVLKFLDFKLIIETSIPEHQLLFNGFLFYKDFIKNYELSAFTEENIYLNLIEFRNSSLIHIKELNLLKDLFIDPITVNVLEDINEPTDYLKLLLRANELLKDFSHPDSNDPNYSRIRGYDRVPGLMYKALAESLRDYKIKNRSNSKIELDPYKVWNYVTQDSTVKIN